MPRPSSEMAIPPAASPETAVGAGVSAGLAENGDRIRSIGYFGAKAGEGVWQTIINQIPPHDQFIEAFAGSATITRLKKPSNRSTIAIDSDAAVCEVLKLSLPGAIVIKADAVGWLERWIRTNPHAPNNFNATCLYLDPPYLFAARSSPRRRYRHEFGTESEHVRLLRLFRYCGFSVLISHPQHGLYDETLKGWRRVDYRCPTRGGPRTESLYCNFPEPVELHDYRFAGANFRERERLKRKRTRWLARLSAMPALERSIILDALRELDLASPGLARRSASP